MSDRQNQQQTAEFTIDEAYEVCGGHGKYQYWVAILTTITYISNMLYLFSIPLFLTRPNIRACTNLGTGLGCDKPQDTCSPDTIYQYEDKYYNFVSEYDLICSDQKAFYIPAAFSIGACLGAFIFSLLGDFIGRIPVLIIGQIGMITSLGYLLLFSSYTVCLITSVLIGFFALACGPPSFIFAYDSMHSKYIPFYASYLNTCFAVGEIIVAALLYTGINWRMMCTMILIWKFLFFFILPMVSESPRYLHSQGKSMLAIQNFKQIAYTNGTLESLPQVFAIKGSSANQISHSFTESMKPLFSRAMLIQLVTCAAIFMSAGFTYFGISMSVQKIKGNVYVNAIANAIAEIFSVVLSGVSAAKFGNKFSLIIFMILTEVGLIGQRFSGESILASSIALYVAKFGISGAFNIGYICAGEIFPTAVKNTALGIGVLFARLGGFIAPLTFITPNSMIENEIILCLFGLIATIPLASDQKEDFKKPLSSSPQNNSAENVEMQDFRPI